MSEKQKPGAVDKINGVPHIYTGKEWVKEGDIVEFILDGYGLTGIVKNWLPGIAVNLQYETLEGPKTCSRLPGHILKVYKAQPFLAERPLSNVLYNPIKAKPEEEDNTYYGINTILNKNPAKENTLPDD